MLPDPAKVETEQVRSSELTATMVPRHIPKACSWRFLLDFSYRDLSNILHLKIVLNFGYKSNGKNLVFTLFNFKRKERKSWQELIKL